MTRTYFIPFRGRYIVYRPLQRLAFVGNSALVQYLRRRPEIPEADRSAEVERFLTEVNFFADGIPEPPDWTPAEPHLPTTAVLLMTSACNLRCIYCYADAGRSPAEAMTPEMARRVIDIVHRNAQLSGVGRFSVSFHGGGEPTLNTGTLRAAVAHAKAKDLPCDFALATNGVWTAEQREFILANVNGISLSFDGIRPVQAAQRPRADGRDCYEEVLATIRHLDRAGISYGVRITVTPPWLDKLPESVEFLCRETGVKSIQVEPTYTAERGRYADLPPLIARRFVRVFMEAHARASAAGRNVFYSGARMGVVAASFCQAPATALVVTPDGRLVTCFEITDLSKAYTAPFAIGRLTESGAEIDRAALDRFAAEQRRRRAECRECFCYWNCCGDCATRSLTRTGTRSSRCLINRGITRELLAGLIADADGCWRELRPKPPGGCC